MPLGDHLPTTPGARALADRGASAPGRGSRRGPVPAGRRASRGGGLRRGYEISNWARPATRAATTSSTGTAGRTRRSGPGAHAFDGVAAALERRAARWIPGGARAGGGGPPSAARRFGDRRCRPAAAEAVILGLRLDTGLDLDEAMQGPLGPHLDWGFANGLLEAFGPADAPRGAPDHDGPPALERGLRPGSLTRTSRAGWPTMGSRRGRVPAQAREPRWRWPRRGG